MPRIRAKDLTYSHVIMVGKTEHQVYVLLPEGNKIKVMASNDFSKTYNENDKVTVK